MSKKALIIVREGALLEICAAHLVEWYLGNCYSIFSMSSSKEDKILNYISVNFLY